MNDILYSLWVLCPDDRSTARRLLNLSTPLDSAIDAAAEEMRRVSAAWWQAYFACPNDPRSVDDWRLLDTLVATFEAAEQRYRQLLAAVRGE